MRIEIETRPVFYFYLNKTQVKILMKLSSLHYDSTCKAAGQPGGFIWGWHNTVEYNSSLPGTKDKMRSSGTFQDLDLCLKLIETVHYANLPQHELDIIRQLERDFRGALQLSRTKFQDWRISYKGDA